MKKQLFLLLILLTLSCKKESAESFGKPDENVSEVQKPEDLGKSIFEGKGNCIACHQVAQKVVGPSLQEIAKIYKDKNANMVQFLKGEGEPIVDPAQYEVMKANFVITKTMSDEELKALEIYVYSHLK
ncbi:c-type cytochrome [Flavobacterium psychrotolerans]|uniref:Cytochrome C552 n=1 Tax=Flavobacterium psychrotolerans TaxID=2169410 RepID=A0A2U1JHC5_9FLAO|nr:c-type cytochrome [Flavobacterium psychrotolerans]PWA04536.1 cytochrome C552 [Flavobacterium psychrotolerans]